MLDKGSGTMRYKEVAIAEAPEHTDTGQTAIAGGSQVNVAVTNVDCSDVGGKATDYSSAQLAQSFVYGVGSRFLVDAGSLVFTNGDLYLREEVTDQFLRGRHHLIANYCHLATSRLQFMNQFGNAVVRVCSVERMLHVVLAEAVKNSFEQGILCTVGYCKFHQPTHTIAHKTTNVIRRMRRHTILQQSMVHAIG